MTTATASKPVATDHGVPVGAIFYSSWGYDQTNIDFFEVVGVTKSSVKVRHVQNHRVGTNGYTDEVVPATGEHRFQTWTGRQEEGGESKIQTRRVKDGYSGTPTINVEPGGFAWLWDGIPSRETNSAFGH